VFTMIIMEDREKKSCMSKKDFLLYLRISNLRSRRGRLSTSNTTTGDCSPLSASNDMLALLKKHPLHFAVIAVCAYPMVMVASGKYDHILLPQNTAPTTTTTKPEGAPTITTTK
jgi:hypothetical protein